MKWFGVVVGLALLLQAPTAVKSEEGNAGDFGFDFTPETFEGAMVSRAAREGARVRGIHFINCASGPEFFCGFRIEPSLAMRVYAPNEITRANMITIQIGDRRRATLENMLFPMALVIQTVEPSFDAQRTQQLIEELMSFQYSLNGEARSWGEVANYRLYQDRKGLPIFEAEPIGD